MSGALIQAALAHGAYVGLKCFQTRNVAAGRVVTVGMTALVLGGAEALALVRVVEVGLTGLAGIAAAGVALAVGGSLGAMAAVALHRRLYRGAP